MWKKILLGLAVIVVVFLVVVAMQPSDFSISRTATMSAPPGTAFAQVNELKKWEAWSPWTKIDPAMKQTYDGPASGKGASYSWAGNKDVGEGRMTITESLPNEVVRFNLEFFKPMEGVCTSEFTFKPQGNQTAITWSMAGKNNFIAKAMCLFMSMDKMVGGQFENGLAAMKAIVEAGPKVSLAFCVLSASQP